MIEAIARGPALRRRALLAIAIGAAPLLAAPLAGRALADRAAVWGAGELARAAAHLDRPGGATREALVPMPQEIPAEEPEAAAADLVAPALAEPKRRAAAGAPPAPAPASHRGLLIRAPVVARAVRSGARPDGTPVPASGARPAGLALHGIGHLGAGLRDGDVLTSVGGTTATSVGAVVGAVAGAIRSGARVITATVWRGDQRIQVAIEIPRRRRG